MNRRKLIRFVVAFGFAAFVLLVSHTMIANAQGRYMFNPVGTWYGNAKPAVSPGAFPEVVMIPTFLADGNVVANDSHETTNPHTTAKGRWILTGPYSMQATFIWINLDAKAPNGFGGTFKVRLKGTALVPNTDSMGGTLDIWFFPPGTDPLDPADKGGIYGGVFVIEKLRRVVP